MTEPCLHTRIDDEHEEEIAYGGWTSLCFGRDDAGYYLVACGDERTDRLHISYCPFCGAELRR